jgi:hypothetical protein
MAKTAKRLVGPGVITNSAVTKYTVPASTKTIVRHIHVANTSAAAATFTMSIGANADGTQLWDAYSIPAQGYLDIWVYFVLEAAEIIQALSGTTSVLNLTIDGDEITLG